MKQVEIKPRRLFNNKMEHVKDAIAYKLLPIMPGDTIHSLRDESSFFVVAAEAPQIARHANKRFFTQSVCVFIPTVVQNSRGPKGITIDLYGFGRDWIILRSTDYDQEKDAHDKNQKPNRPRIVHDSPRKLRRKSSKQNG
jgi:hypothetical protein